MNAIILAGGRASRFGSDKASVKIGGATLIEREIEVLRGLFKKIIIVSNHLLEIASSPSAPRNDIVWVKDLIKDCGPLAGIYSGLKASDTLYNFVVACDMPFLNPDIIRFMLYSIKNYDIVVIHKNGKVQPLCALYSKNCIKPIEDQLRKGNLRIRDFFKFVKVKRIPEERVARFDLEGLAFANINTKKDYKKYKDVLNYYGGN